MNEISKSDVYADAGVDITAGYKAVELMKKHIARTLTSGVCSDVLFHQLHCLVSRGYVNARVGVYIGL